MITPNFLPCSAHCWSASTIYAWTCSRVWPGATSFQSWPSSGVGEDAEHGRAEARGDLDPVLDVLNRGVATVFSEVVKLLRTPVPLMPRQAERRGV
jgi:hypothetical protein